jgi:Tol biopolymer transport system component
MGLNLFLDAADPRVEPGAEAVIGVRVTNTGRVVDRISFDVVGDARTWVSVEPAELALLPGATGGAALHLRPPRNSTVLAGRVPVGVRAVSEADPAGSRTEEVVVEVLPFADVALKIVPRRSRGRRRALHRLDVTNLGNSPVTVQVEGSDPDEALTLKPRPPSLEVGPGRTGRVRVRVVPRDLFMSGPPELRPFTMTASSAAGALASVEGGMLQSPTMPRWVPRLAAVVVLLAIAAIVLSQTVFRPDSSAQSGTSATASPQVSGSGPATGKAGTPTPAPRSGPRPILFVRLYSGGGAPPPAGAGISDIYAMAADGSNVVDLTHGEGISDDPAWSPDGQRIAFKATRTGDATSQIYVMKADGSQVAPVTQPTSAQPNDSYRRPAWSPDGASIAFVDIGPGSTSAIEVAKPDGSQVVTLVTSPDADLDHPTWSPDGRHIAYSGASAGHLAIFVMNSDGSGATRLFADPGGDDTEPAWSPDGTRIAFTGQANGNRAIFEATISSNLVAGTPKATFQSTVNYAATWSSDSRQLVFTSTRFGSDEIVLANADASGGRIRLTTSSTGSKSYHPAWFAGPSRSG